jgi:hypothetical protein
LKRQVVIWPQARETWDCRVYSLEIHKEEGIPQTRQCGLESFCVVPRLVRLNAGSRPALNLGQFEVVRDVVDGLDADLLKFLHRAGVDPRQVANMVIWARRIALLEEFTPNWVTALLGRRDLRRAGHVEHGELCSKLERQLGLQPLDSARQVPDLVEPSHVNVLPIENIMSIDVRETAGTNIQPTA